MSLSDPIADMLTRIRNAGAVQKPTANIKASKICEGVASVLKTAGYIEDYDKIEDGKQGIIRVSLKYTLDGTHVINEIKRISKPGCRVYKGVKELPEVLGGLGICIVSTSNGVMSDNDCRDKKIGGEIICTVS